jgi:hypothetical protein
MLTMMMLRMAFAMSFMTKPPMCANVLLKNWKAQNGWFDSCKDVDSSKKCEKFH